MRPTHPPAETVDPAYSRIKRDGQPLDCQCSRPDCSARVYRLAGHDRCGEAHMQSGFDVRV